MSYSVKYSTIIEKIILITILTLVFLYDATRKLGFLDELVALIALLILIFHFGVKGRIKLYRKEYYILTLLLIVFIIGLLSNFFTYRSGFITGVVAIIGDIINFNKAFVIYFSLRILSSSFSSAKVLKRITKYSYIIFYIIIILVLLDVMIGLFPHASRYGIYSVELYFQHPSRFGFAIAFIFLTILPKYYYKKKSILFFALSIGALSLRVKYFGFGIIAVFFIFYGKKLFNISKFYFIAVITILGMFSVWLFWDWIEMYFTFDVIENAWSRAVLLYYSFTIGNDFFPLGTGFGSYSSYYSGLYYSWVYDYYGISGVYGMSSKYWGFIADQYWPMVLGEFGYFGLIATISIIANYFSLLFNGAKENINNYQYNYFMSAILGLIMLLIDSTSDAIFTQQRAVVMFIYFALVVNMSVSNEKNELIEEKDLIVK